MKKVFLLTSVATSLLLTGCISLKSDSVGQEFESVIDEKIKNALAEPTVVQETTAANVGKRFKLGFNASDAILVKSKDLTAGINGINASNKIRGVGKATSLFFVKNKAVWDRIQGHAITVELGLEAGTSLSSDPKKEDFTIESVLMSYRGNTAKNKTGHTFADVTEKLADFKYDIEKIKALLPNGVTANIGDIGNLFDPQIKHEPNLYGVYGSKETQYTAFYSSALAITTKEQLAKKTGATQYKDLEFRGITKGDIDGAPIVQTNLYGTGSANINFQTGAYESTINVTTDKANTTNFGKIEFKGTNAAVKLNEAENLAATFTKAGTGTVVNGNAEFAVYGKNGEAVMGTTDFTNGNFALVGAFGAKPKNAKIE